LATGQISVKKIRKYRYQFQKNDIGQSLFQQRIIITIFPTALLHGSDKTIIQRWNHFISLISC